MANDTLSAELTSEEKSYFDTRGGEVDPPQDLPQDDPPQDDSPEDDPIDDDAPTAEQPEGEQPQRRRKVDYKALQEARAALNKEREERIREKAQWDSRLQLVNEFLTKQGQPQEQAPEPIQIPDPEIDPVGALKFLMQGVGAMAQARAEDEKQAAERTKREEEVRQAQHVERQAWNAYLGDHKRFLGETPDYEAALQHVGNLRAKQLRTASFGKLTDQDIANRLGTEYRAAIYQALQAGISPAEHLYKLALESGYQPQASQPEGQDSRLDQLDRAQRANRSLSSTSGGAPAGGPMTLDKFLRMPDDQARKYMEKNPEAFRRLQGG